MCTCFTYKGNDVITAMNFDNCGMEFSLNEKRKDKFAVRIESAGRKEVSFGVNAEGVFAAQLVVPSNGKAFYKRASNKVTHTSRLLNDLLDGRIVFDSLVDYLDITEVVNIPNMSLHCFCANAKGNVVIVEPGRENLFAKERYSVLGNCAVTGEDRLQEFGVDRYNRTIELLEAADSKFGVEEAFMVLKAVNQTEGNWITDFSMVYSANENAVYYCYYHDFDSIMKYTFD